MIPHVPEGMIMRCEYSRDDWNHRRTQWRGDNNIESLGVGNSIEDGNGRAKRGLVITSLYMRGTQKNQHLDNLPYVSNVDVAR